MIEDIITIPLIQLRVKTTDWRDAIKKSGRVLVENGDVTQNYVEGNYPFGREVWPVFRHCAACCISTCTSSSGRKEISYGHNHTGSAHRFPQSGK